jgi:hypothetical protein
MQSGRRAREVFVDRHRLAWKFCPSGASRRWSARWESARAKRRNDGRREALDFTDNGAQRGTRQCTDDGDLTQLVDAHIGASKSVELTLDAEDLLLE